MITRTTRRTDNVVKQLSAAIQSQYIEANNLTPEEAKSRVLAYYENLLSRCAYENKDLYDMLAARLHKIDQRKVKEY